MKVTYTCCSAEAAALIELPLQKGTVTSKNIYPLSTFYPVQSEVKSCFAHQYNNINCLTLLQRNVICNDGHMLSIYKIQYNVHEKVFSFSYSQN